jgi:two-component system chemotaxis response regulator CheY
MSHEIFIVEDDPAVYFFYKQALDLNGFTLVGLAEDGEEAVSKFKSFSRKPQVILMDHRMPKKNGIDASKEILQIDPQVKIIFISADESIKEEVFTIGVFSFYKKPVKIKKMINEINNALKCYHNSS